MTYTMKVTFRANPSYVKYKTVSNPFSGAVAATYFRAMAYIDMWNDVDPKYLHEMVAQVPMTESRSRNGKRVSMRVSNSTVTQRKFALEEIAVYEDVEF